MAILTYKDGSFQDCGNIKQYQNGAFQDVSSGKVYVDGSWQEVYPNLPSEIVLWEKNGAINTGLATSANVIKKVQGSGRVDVSNNISLYAIGSPGYTQFYLNVPVDATIYGTVVIDVGKTTNLSRYNTFYPWVYCGFITPSQVNTFLHTYDSDTKYWNYLDDGYSTGIETQNMSYYETNPTTSMYVCVEIRCSSPSSVCPINKITLLRTSF